MPLCGPSLPRKRPPPTPGSPESDAVIQPWVPLVRAFALSALLLPASVGSLLAQERIESYEVSIDVTETGDLVVHEMIVVHAEGREIRRGIYRDIETVSSIGFGFVRRHSLGVLSVERDGEPEPHHIAREGMARGTQRIYVGSRDRTLEPGRTEYSLTYRTGGWLHHHDDEDDLYWDAIPT